MGSSLGSSVEVASEVFHLVTNPLPFAVCSARVLFQVTGTGPCLCAGAQRVGRGTVLLVPEVQTQAQVFLVWVTSRVDVSAFNSPRDTSSA